MQGERFVGGVGCSEVLALLPDVAAGTLDERSLERVALHLAGCSVCERFGGAYGAAIRALEAGGRLGGVSPPGETARSAERLLAALAELPPRPPRSD